MTDGDKKSKILASAMSLFLRYGFRRVNMNDIAEAAGISRPAIYLLFRNKEDIFIGVYLQWVDETISGIELAMETSATSQEKIACAFELWASRPFDLILNSSEAKELIECTFDFAKDAMLHGSNRFESAIAPTIASFIREGRGKAHLAPERAAHVLASAVRGFKHTATTTDELRQLIKDLLVVFFDVRTSAAMPPPTE